MHSHRFLCMPTLILLTTTGWTKVLASDLEPPLPSSLPNRIASSPSSSPGRALALLRSPSSSQTMPSSILSTRPTAQLDPGDSLPLQPDADSKPAVTRIPSSRSFLPTPYNPATEEGEDNTSTPMQPGHTGTFSSPPMATYVPNPDKPPTRPHIGTRISNPAPSSSSPLSSLLTVGMVGAGLLIYYWS